MRGRDARATPPSTWLQNKQISGSFASPPLHTHTYLIVLLLMLMMLKIMIFTQNTEIHTLSYTKLRTVRVATSPPARKEYKFFIK